MRLLQIDDATRGDHRYLAVEDYCLYQGEYTARGGFGCSPMNDMILNIKKSVTRRGRQEYQYKERDIRRAGEVFRAALSAEALATVTFVPVPPSKAITHPEYDNRIELILAHMAEGSAADVRQLVIQNGSYEPSSQAALRGGERMHADDLIALYAIDEAIAAPAPRRIFIVDDVLTTGSHFVAMKTVLRRRYPEAWIGGLFIARRRIEDDAVQQAPD